MSGLQDAHATLFPSPPIKRLFCDAMFATGLSNIIDLLRFPQYRDDLLLWKPLLH